MKCPVCPHELVHRNAGGVEVDVCDGGCGGIWFDNHELSRLDESHEHAGAELLDVAHDPEVRVEHDGARACPACEGAIPMMRHFWSVKRQVEIDRCPACGGTWLDTGELGMIRDAFPTEEERRQAAREHFDDLFGNELAAMKEESEEQLRKARRFALTFRFLSPSWYIPGRQWWGAF